jgi:hypothetical protein
MRDFRGTGNFFSPSSLIRPADRNVVISGAVRAFDAITTQIYQYGCSAVFHTTKAGPSIRQGH